MKTDNIKSTPEHTLKRRKVLGLIGTVAAGSMLGKSLSQTSTNSRGNTIPACVVVPRHTEGPYFVDEKLNRDDIRPDPETGLISTGIPLNLKLKVSQINGATCTPLQNAIVEVWQTDAMGEYSDVRDRLYDTRGKKFLRGYQHLDANGRVEFLTVYPGWYPSRTVHIHFMVRTEDNSGKEREFTSQLYFDDAITDQVHQQSPYNDNGQRKTRNSNDRIYRRGGSQLMLQLEKSGEGYDAYFELGIS